MRRLPISSRAAARAATGHPWVYANEIRAPLADLSPGELVLLTGKNDEPCGVGYANPRSLIAVRILSHDAAAIDAGFFAARLERAEALRRRVRPGASAYRLCYGEGDHLPGLVIDRYDDVYVIASHTAGIDALMPSVVEGFASRRADRAACSSSRIPPIGASKA